MSQIVHKEKHMQIQVPTLAINCPKLSASQRILPYFDQPSMTSDFFSKMLDRFTLIDSEYNKTADTLLDKSLFSSTLRKNKNQISKVSRQQILHRADCSVRQLSTENRIKSTQKIKTAQIYFRFKLKMMGLLRVMGFKAEQIQRIKSLQTQNFIIDISSKIKAQFRNCQNQFQTMKQKYEALTQTLKLKNQQINELRLKLVEKEKQNYQISLKSTNNYKQYRVQLLQKQKEIDSLSIMLIQLKAKLVAKTSSKQNHSNNISLTKLQKSKNESNREQSIQSNAKKWKIPQNCIEMLQKCVLLQRALINSLPQQAQICKNQKNTINTISRQTQTMSNNWDTSKCEQNIYDAKIEQILAKKMSQIIEQWKNHMYWTVNEYEQMLQNCNNIINKKEEQIKCLKILN